MERVDKHGAAAILGVTPRVAISMISEFSKAAKIGRSWSFDVKELRQYVRQACVKLPQGVSGATVFSSAVPKLQVEITNGLYEQTIQRLRSKGARMVRSGS